MVRIRRTDSATAALASCEVSRRPCRRSSEEMVCRLFFTRWWISRIVASLLSSRRSRLRTSVTSRSSSTPPVTDACGGDPDRIGMHRVSRVTSSVWSNSSITGAIVSNALRIGASLNPSSARRSPTALALMPTRCNADTALGEA